MKKLFLVGITLCFFILLQGETVMNKNDTGIKVEFFSAAAPDSSIKGITDEKIATFNMEMEKMMPGTLVDAIPLFFENKIEKLQSQAACDNIFFLKNMNSARWMIFDYLIKLSVKESPGNKTIVNLEFLDMPGDRTITRDVDIAKDKTTLAVLKKKDKAVILAFYAPGAIGHYNSEFRFADFILYSENQTWNFTGLEKPEVVFPRAKAVLTRLNPHIALLGEKITYDKKNNRLIGEKAKIIDTNGKQLGAGDKIIILIANPDKYEIQ